MQDLPPPPPTISDYRDYSAVAKDHASKMLNNSGNLSGALESPSQGHNTHPGIKSEDTSGDSSKTPGSGPTPGGFLDISPQLPGVNNSIANSMAATQALSHNSFAPYPPSYLNSYPQMDPTGYHGSPPGQNSHGGGAGGAGTGLGHYPFSMNHASNLSPYSTGYGQARMGYPTDPYQNPVSSLMNSKSIDRWVILIYFIMLNF